MAAAAQAAIDIAEPAQAAPDKAAERVLTNIGTLFTCVFTHGVPERSVRVKCPECDVRARNYEGRVFDAEEWDTFLVQQYRLSESFLECPFCRHRYSREGRRTGQLAFRQKDTLTLAVPLEWKDVNILQQRLAADSAKQQELGAAAGAAARTIADLRQQLSDAEDRLAQVVATREADVAVAVALTSGRMTQRGLAFTGAPELRLAMLAMPPEHVGAVLAFTDTAHAAELDRQEALRDARDVRDAAERDARDAELRGRNSAERDALGKKHKRETDERDTKSKKREIERNVRKNKVRDAFIAMQIAHTPTQQDAAMQVFNENFNGS